MRTLTLTLVTTVIAATIGFGFIISWIYSELYPTSEFSEEHKAYQNISQQLSKIIQHNPTKKASLEFWNSSGEINAQLEDRDSLILPQKLEDRFELGETIALEFEEGIKFYSLIHESDQILVITPPAAIQEDRPYEKIALTLIFYVGVVLAIAAWLLPLFIRLRLLDKTAQDFGRGNLTVRLPDNKMSYIKNIETEFNTMAERIQQLIKDNKLLSRAVSHDLKTPLARLRFGLDTIMEEHNPDKREIYHDRINNDLDKMESLIFTLLDYAKLDDAHISMAKKPINLADLVSDEIKHLKHISNKSITTTLSILSEGAVMVSADDHYLRMIIHNLVINALNHAKSDVEISVYRQESHAYFLVEDDGPGVNENDTDRIFKPFQRGVQPNSNSRKDEGHGMGLAICERVGQWFDAEISLERSPSLGGASFRLKIPLLKPA